MAKTPSATDRDLPRKPRKAAARTVNTPPKRKHVSASTTSRAARELRDGEVYGRDGEILSRARATGFINEFDVPERYQESGWSRQWMRVACTGKPDPANINACHENGWRPVSPQTMPGYMPDSAQSGYIERDGLRLMERPQVLTDEANEDERRDAAELRQAQTEQFGARKLPKGYIDGYAHKGKDAGKQVRRAIEPSPIDLLPKREIAIGDDND